MSLFCISVPVWRHSRGIKRPENMTHHTPCLNRWAVKAEIPLFFDTKIAVYTTNAKLISKCLHHVQCVVTKIEPCVPLCAILGLPFSFSRRAWALMIWGKGFTFPPTSIHLLFIPFTYFFAISHPVLCSLVLCSGEMFNPISPSFYLFFAVSHQEAERIWKSSLSLFSPRSLLFPFQTVGSIKHGDILGKYHSVFASDLSALFDLFKPLWTSSSPQC